MITFTAESFREYVTRQYGTDDAPGILQQVGRWLARGDGAAVYENQDLSHPDLGECRIASYGSPAAQLETDRPPQRLPDIGGLIGWHYILAGTYRP